MIERELELATGEGTMDVFVAQPEGGGPFAPVILYMYVGGVGEKMRNLARRVAREGYCALVPNLYYRAGRISFEVDNRHPASVAVRGIVRPMIDDHPRMMADTRAVLDAIDADPAIAKGPVGCVGYCMGGGLAIIAANTYPERIRAAASMFGTRIYSDSPASPHLSLSRIAGELYCGMAEFDQSMSLEAVASFEAALKRDCRARWQVEIHPGTHHGFAIEGRVYDHAASERAWERIFAMYGRMLGSRVPPTR